MESGQFPTGENILDCVEWGYSKNTDVSTTNSSSLVTSRDDSSTEPSTSSSSFRKFREAEEIALTLPKKPEDVLEGFSLKETGNRPAKYNVRREYIRKTQKTKQGIKAHYIEVGTQQKRKRKTPLTIPNLDFDELITFMREHWNELKRFSQLTPASVGEASYNDKFCMIYWSCPYNRKSYELFIDNYFANPDPDYLCKISTLVYCGEPFHEDNCYIKWARLKLMLKKTLIECLEGKFEDALSVSPCTCRTPAQERREKTEEIDKFSLNGLETCDTRAKGVREFSSDIDEFFA